MSPSTPSGPPRPRTPGRSAGKPDCGPVGRRSGRPAGPGSGRPAGRAARPAAGPAARPPGREATGSGRTGRVRSPSGPARDVRRARARSARPRVPARARRVRLRVAAAAGPAAPGVLRAHGAPASRGGIAPVAPARPPMARRGADGPRPSDDRPDRGQVVRKGWGSVARRGASHRAGRRRPRSRRGHPGGPASVADADRRVRARGVRPGRRPVGRAVGPGPAPGPPARARARRAAGRHRPGAGHRGRSRLELPPDRISERMAAGIGAYERERYRDAARILRTVVDAVPERPLAPGAARPVPVPPGQLEGRACPTSRCSPR